VYVAIKIMQLGGGNLEEGRIKISVAKYLLLEKVYEYTVPLTTHPSRALS